MIELLRQQMERFAAGHQKLQVRGGSEQLGDLDGRKHLLDIVENQEHLALTQIVVKHVGQQRGTRVRHSQPLTEGGKEVAALANRGEIDEVHSVREVWGDGPAHLLGEPGLADAAWTGQCEQPDVTGNKKGGDYL